MGGTTANRGYRYPSSTDNTQIWNHIQNLAGDVDTDVAALYAALGTWTSFSPLLYSQTSGTRASISRTVTRARYLKIGSTCWAYADVLANASSSSSASLALPFSAVAQYICGYALITGTSPPAAESGAAFIHTTLDTVVAFQANTGYTDIVSGQRFRYSICYETA